MIDEPIFPDEELTAYLDGEHEHVDVPRLELALELDDMLRARLDALDIDRVKIASAFENILVAAPPALIPTPEPQVKKSRWFVSRNLIALGLVCFLAGGTASYLILQQKDETWRAYVAAYQALYVNDTLDTVSSSDAIQGQQLARASTAIGKILKPGAVRDSGRLSFKRAQILGFEGRPLVQLAYLSETGIPVALCIIRSERSTPGPLQTAVMEGMEAAFWSRDGYDFMLIGGTDAGLIGRSAARFAKAL